ncbi:uncharacterized protein LOC129588389 [Paramacrobiotus metropolitanus]|uniref:uncharacterized protein LOC129588389 n=1 Tax=Paramacrobiotus metropolitanus TaxID=2943436 RepID=UPI002445B59B|nr:uncharacterized protein LOC129588389 [Paramacrobiotus metropolitanus]
MAKLGFSIFALCSCIILILVEQKAGVSARSRSSKPATTSCGKSFCEHASNYPLTDTNKKSLESDPKLAFLKGAVPTKGSSGLADDDPDIPNQAPQLQLCQSKVDIIYPQEAENIRGQRRFIINFGPFTQGLTIERCTVDNFRLPCNYVGIPPAYQSICIQRESEHRLNTIETDASGQVQTSVDTFRFPSYCACKIIPAPMAATLQANRCAPEAAPFATGPQFYAAPATAVLQPLTTSNYAPAPVQGGYGQGLASNAGFAGAGGYGQMGYDGAPVSGSGASLTGRSDGLFNSPSSGFNTGSNGAAAPAKSGLAGFPTSSRGYPGFFIQ